MRQSHAAGERLFVDYVGPTIDFMKWQNGEVVTCQLFVAVLGAFSYTYAEATLTQSLPDWCSSHERAFKFFGGVDLLRAPGGVHHQRATAPTSPCAQAAKRSELKAARARKLHSSELQTNNPLTIKFELPTRGC